RTEQNYHMEPHCARRRKQPLMETLTAWCQHEMDHLLQGQLTLDATTWSARGLTLQERMDWLHGECQRTRMPETGSFDKLLNEKGSHGTVGFRLGPSREIH
ncbi:MAG: hypothetical protein ACKPKO_38630, partial [Candidatus Fonsibacter sp.]